MEYQPAEIVGIRIRAAANALSTASNWTLVKPPRCECQFAQPQE